MTHPHPRDPRHRRRDPLAAAVSLELAVDAMRGQQLDRGAEPELLSWQQHAVDDDDEPLLPAPVLTSWHQLDESTTITEQLAAAVVTSVQLGTVEPPLTADEFAAAVALDAELLELPESPAPAVAPPVTDYAPLMPASAQSDDPPPPVFSSEHRRPVLTWRSRHDPESRRYGVRQKLRGSAPLENVVLPIGPVLDQGEEGECVTYAITAALNVLELVDVDLDDELHDAETARRLFPIAQRRDEIPGEGYLGTSILGGLQATLEAGLIGGYLWAFGTKDIAQNVLRRRRPVVVGVSWLSGMYDTGPGGLVELTGDDEGLGHALAVVGLKLKGPQGQPGPFFVWQNSWGSDYGDGGLGYVHHRDLALLLRGRGEAGIPTREVQVPTP